MTCIMLLCSIGIVHAQQTVTIKGVIKGDGEPLLGASVLVVGTNNGTVSDFDGNYQLTAVSGQKISITYLGFVGKVITMPENNTTLNIVLEKDATQLDEVVVVGYGSQKKKEVTGAVVNIDSEVISKTPTSDVGSALQGQIAGVDVQTSGGSPGSPANIQIRGLGSISPNALGPLYVVDGVPYQGNPNIAPEQIQSIDVLKDGASAAIYGTRASNGVILITTKKGEEGKMKVSFSTYTGIQNITSGTPLMNTTQQLYENQKASEAKGIDSPILRFNSQGLDNNSDFVGDVQNNNAVMSNYNLNVSGGTKYLTLSLNTNYFTQDGVLINSGFNRLSNRITGEYKKGKFKAFATIGFRQDNKETEPWGLYEYAIAQGPYQASLSSLESRGDNAVQIPVQNAIQYSYLSQLLQNENKTKTTATNIAVNLEYEILKGLKYKINLGSNNSNYVNTFYKPQYIVYDLTGNINPGASRPNAFLNENYNWQERQTVENILNYSRSFGKNNFNLLGVISYEKYDYKQVGVGVMYSADANSALQTLGSGSESIAPSSTNNTSTLTGKLVRFQYNYDSKYLFSASVRRDGSSKFSPKNRYGTFPAVSLGWNIDKEDFMSNIKSISGLKLRASWAEVGNQNIGNYAFTPTIETGVNYVFNTGASEELNNGFIQRRYVDPNIKWETTISKNIGLDLGMFKNRLNVNLDLYENDKKDMLLQERLTPSSGTYQPRADGVYDVRVTNAGSMSNKGVELGVQYRDETNYGLKYTLNGTFTKNVNTVTDLNGVDRGYANGRPVLSRGTNVDYTTYLAEGYRAGSFFLVQHDGIIKTQDQLTAYQAIDNSAQLGDMMYKDVNGDNKIDDNDRVYSGSGQAKFNVGFNINLDYRNFDFTAQTYFSYGAKVYNGSKLYAYQAGRHLDLYNMWTPQNPTSDVPTDRQNAFANSIRARSDYFLEDGTYFRIRNLTLGYTVPKTKERAKIEKARVYLTAVNPFTFTKYKGYNPDIGGDGIFTRGVDVGNYPFTRQFMLGLQLDF
ncbi:SusC/RagA family TonB-linked outer membrane protein [Wenyingzhuangia fucanilytica]|nr:TonB-dependent receptor [Wenyingzhuangia fucanilytica]